MNANPDDRYSRQRLFEKIGEEGQRKLAAGRIVVVGCGALGSMIANNIVRAGVGHVLLVDRDVVELSNLPRQQLFDESHAANRVPKAVAARDRLHEINSEMELRAEVIDVTPANIEALVDGVDLILDGTDNMETRFLINDVSVKHGVPWIYGGAVGASGMTMTVLPGDTACLTCVLEECPPPGTVATADTDGVLNSLTAVVASLQTTEAMKILMGGEQIRREILYIDVWEGTFRSIHAERRDDCLTCARHEYTFLNATS